MAKTKIAMKAQEIRKELKHVFPSTKFSVTSHDYAGGGSVTIRWTDLPPVKLVEEAVRKYEEVDRDEATGEILMGANYFIFTKQEISEELDERIELAMPDDLDYFQKGLWKQRLLQEIYDEHRGEYEIN